MVKLLLIILIISFGLQGCETFKGAKEGFEKDLEKAKEADTWFRKNAW